MGHIKNSCRKRDSSSKKQERVPPDSAADEPPAVDVMLCVFFFLLAACGASCQNVLFGTTIPRTFLFFDKNLYVSLYLTEGIRVCAMVPYYNNTSLLMIPFSLCGASGVAVSLFFCAAVLCSNASLYCTSDRAQMTFLHGAHTTFLSFIRSLQACTPRP